jgi:hypothetical protein
MNILKYAFEEGRDTKVSWENSESLRMAHLAELRMNNIIRIRNHPKGQKRKIAQLHLKTGRVINVFSSIFQAARWINSRRKGFNTQTQDYQAYSNIYMMASRGSHAYGYYWMLLSPDNDIPVTVNMPKSKKKRSNKPRTFYIDRGKGLEKIVGSKAIEQQIPITYATLIRRLVDTGGKYEIGNMIVYTETGRKKMLKEQGGMPVIMRNLKGHYKSRFRSHAEAAKHLNVSVLDIANSVRYGKSIGDHKFFAA